MFNIFQFAATLNLIVHCVLMLQIAQGYSTETGQKTKRSIVPIGQYYLPHYQSNFNNFHYSNFLNQGYGHAMEFMQFFQHIQLPEYPEEIVIASHKVMQYLAQTPINFIDLVEAVNLIPNLNPADRLVALLLRLQARLPLDCAEKSDISTVILYNMMKSYLSYVPVLQMVLPQSFDMYLHPSNDEGSHYKEIIELLLNKLKCCQAKVLHIQEELLHVQRTPIIQYIEKPTPAYPEVNVRLLEPETTPAPEIVTEIRYIEKPCTTVPIPTPITAAPIITTSESPYIAYVNVLQQPSNAFEKMKFELVSAFLHRADLQVLLGHIDFAGAESQEAKLNLILEAAMKLELEKATHDAIRYYLSLTKKAVALNLSMQQQISRQFDLTKIFSASYDFEHLSVAAKEAFDTFFNFLLEVSGEQMVNFTNWHSVHTKGAFIKLLYEYFLKQDYTPIEVKEAIHVLLPFIWFEGGGAEPLD